MPLKKPPCGYLSRIRASPIWSSDLAVFSSLIKGLASQHYTYIGACKWLQSFDIARHGSRINIPKLYGAEIGNVKGKIEDKCSWSTCLLVCLVRHSAKLSRAERPVRAAFRLWTIWTIKQSEQCIRHNNFNATVRMSWKTRKS